MIGERFRVVLVEPENSLNIGSVARAMMNLGFPYLRLVTPAKYDRSLARVTACHAEPLLDRLEIHPTLADALADAGAIVGLSGRPGENPARFRTLPQWSAELPERPLPVTALVFGSEGNGLRQEHLDRCQYILQIPASEEMSSFNLAQAVLIVLYEIRRTLGETATVPPLPPERLPTGNDREQLDRLTDEVMRLSGFVREGTPRPVPGTVRNLFRRLDMDRHEMGILLGLFGKLRRSLLRTSSQNEES
ncbi:MAG: TrmH family RNA methyltransferase [Capsulimonadales bacterium]|nr:TrmH family RNA methyltransferase [Capsulimonadales bacterium]